MGCESTDMSESSNGAAMWVQPWSRPCTKVHPESSTSFHSQKTFLAFVPPVHEDWREGCVTALGGFTELLLKGVCVVRRQHDAAKAQTWELRLLGAPSAESCGTYNLPHHVHVRIVCHPRAPAELLGCASDCIPRRRPWGQEKLRLGQQRRGARSRMRTRRTHANYTRTFRWRGSRAGDHVERCRGTPCTHARKGPSLVFEMSVTSERGAWRPPPAPRP
jgi:ribosomal protein L32